MSNRNGDNSGQQGGCGDGSQGRGHGNRGGHGNGGRFHGCDSGHGFVKETIKVLVGPATALTPKHWNDMAWEERSDVLEAHKCAYSANNANVNGTNNNRLTITGPPTDVNVADGADQNNNC